VTGEHLAYQRYGFEAASAGTRSQRSVDAKSTLDTLRRCFKVDVPCHHATSVADRLPGTFDVIVAIEARGHTARRPTLVEPAGRAEHQADCLEDRRPLEFGLHSVRSHSPE
jgi:protein-tyrosine-phosphatase